MKATATAASSPGAPSSSPTSTASFGSGQFVPVVDYSSATAFPAVGTATATTSASRLALMSSDESLPSSGTSTPFSKMPSPFRRRADGDAHSSGHGLFADFESGAASPATSPKAATAASAAPSVVVAAAAEVAEDEEAAAAAKGWKTGEKRSKSKRKVRTRKSQPLGEDAPSLSSTTSTSTSTDDGGEGSSGRRGGTTQGKGTPSSGRTTPTPSLTNSNGRVATLAHKSKNESERESDGEKRRERKSERDGAASSERGMMRCTSDGVTLVRKEKRGSSSSAGMMSVAVKKSSKDKDDQRDKKKEKKEKTKEPKETKSKKSKRDKEKLETKKNSLVRRAKSERKMNRVEKMAEQLGSRHGRRDGDAGGGGGVSGLAESARAVKVGMRRGISLEDEEMTIERLRLQAQQREHEQLREMLMRVEQQKRKEEEELLLLQQQQQREQQRRQSDLKAEKERGVSVVTLARVAGADEQKTNQVREAAETPMEERVRRLEDIVERLLADQAEMRRRHDEAVEALKREHEDALQQMILQMKHLRETLLLNGSGGGGKKGAKRVMSGVLPLSTPSGLSPDVVQRRASTSATASGSVLTSPSTTTDESRSRESDTADGRVVVAPLILVNTPYQIDQRQRSATARPRSRSVKEGATSSGEASRRGLTFRSLSSRFLPSNSTTSGSSGNESKSSSSSPSRQRVDGLGSGTSWHHKSGGVSARSSKAAKKETRRNSGSDTQREGDGSSDDDADGDYDDDRSTSSTRTAMAVMTRRRSHSSPRLQSTVAPLSPLSSGRTRGKALDEDKRTKAFWPFSPREGPKAAVWAKLLDEPEAAASSSEQRTAGRPRTLEFVDGEHQTPLGDDAAVQDLHQACLSLDVERAEAVLKAARQRGFDRLRATLGGFNERRQTPLHVASERNPVGLVPMLLQYVQKAESELLRSQSVDVAGPASLVNFRADRDWTPLHSASWAGQLLNCRLLLKANADASLLTASGASVLHMLFDPQCDDGTAIQRHSREELMNLVADMIEHGAPVNASFAPTGETALHFACSRGNVTAVQCLLEHGADLNLCTTTTRETCLHYAARGGREAIARLLLTSGADPEAVGVDGTPLEVAKAAGQESVAVVLQSRARASPSSTSVVAEDRRGKSETSAKTKNEDGKGTGANEEDVRRQ